MVDMWVVRHCDCLKSDRLKLKLRTIIVSKKTACMDERAWLNKVNKGLIKKAVVNFNGWSSKCCLLYNCKVSLLGICRNICCFFQLPLQELSCSSRRRNKQLTGSEEATCYLHFHNSVGMHLDNTFAGIEENVIDSSVVCKMSVFTSDETTS